MIEEQQRIKLQRMKGKQSNYNSAHSAQSGEAIKLEEIAEVKSKSIFAGRSGIYEQHRQMLIQPDIIIKRGMFEKERNLTQALIKHDGIKPRGPQQEEEEKKFFELVQRQRLDDANEA